MELFLNIFIGGLLIGGIYSLVSMGLSLQYGVAKVFNIAHGEFLMFGAFITYWLQSLGVNPLIPILVVATDYVYCWLYPLPYRFYRHQGKVTKPGRF